MSSRLSECGARMYFPRFILQTLKLFCPTIHRPYYTTPYWSSTLSQILFTASTYTQENSSFTSTMAKSQRASTRKRNNANLRTKVFGPAQDARLERLSAKLQEIANTPKPETEKKMEVDSEEQEPSAEDAALEQEKGQSTCW